MEVGIQKGKSEDLLLLISYLKAKNGNEIQVAEHQSGEDLPYLKIGNDSVSGTKTISLYLASLDPKLGGISNLEKAEVDQWLTFCNTSVKPAIEAKSLQAQRSFARVLNEFLLQRVYVATNYLTVADIILYANVYPYIENLQKKQRFEVCNISRWFDLLQHTKHLDLKKPLIEIDLNEERASSKEKEQPQAKEAKPQKGEGSGQAEKKETEVKEAKQKEAKQPKEAKPKEGKQKEAAVPAPKDDDYVAGDADVSRISMIVGFIREVKKHEGADSLYVEQIDLGEEKPRTVVSGLVKAIPIEQMKDRYVIVVANMKPANMRGVTSEAMVLCASDPEGKVEFVEPPPGSKPGDRVYVEGYESGSPDPQLNPKKKIFEKVQPDFKTNEDLVATYRGKPFKTDKGLCKVKSIVGGSIK